MCDEKFPVSMVLSCTSVTSVRDYYLVWHHCVVHLSFVKREDYFLLDAMIRSRNKRVCQDKSNTTDAHTTFPNTLNRFVKIYQMSKKRIRTTTKIHRCFCQTHWLWHGANKINMWKQSNKTKLQFVLHSSLGIETTHFTVESIR